MGVDEDDRQALEWYQRGADVAKEPPYADGIYAEAALRVARMYNGGLGVRQDYSEGMKWLLRAASAGDATAMFWVGLGYKQGLGVAQNSTTAVGWMTKAANAGNAAAQQWLKDHGPK